MSRVAPRNQRIIDRLRDREAAWRASAAENEKTPGLQLDAIKVPDTLALAILLFPGLLAERVAAYFSDAPKLETVEMAATALAATLVSVAITVMLAAVLRKWWSQLDFRQLTLPQMAVSTTFVALVTLVSVTVGLAWAYIDANDKLFAVSPTDRVSRRAVFHTGLKHAKRNGLTYARVETSDSKIYHGLVLFSHASEGEGLYLSAAQIELSSERDPDRFHAKLNECTGEVCRVPISCIDVGPWPSGSVYLPISIVRTVEFRPPIDKITFPNGESGTLYSCDVVTRTQRTSGASASISNRESGEP